MAWKTYRFDEPEEHKPQLAQVKPGVSPPRPVTTQRGLLQIDPEILLWLHRLEQI